MLFHQTQFTRHHYAIPPKKLFISSLFYTTKNTLHVTIMPYHQKHCTFHNYAILPITQFISNCYSTKHIIHVTIMLFEQKHGTCQNYIIQQNRLYTSHLFYTTKHTVHVIITLYHKQILHVTTMHYPKNKVQNIIMLYTEPNYNFHRCALPQNTLYLSPLCHTTKQIVHIIIMLCN